ncbi:MAG: FKBP-type peptidyl-prolyl cis-trans isomerase [Bacteroidales bacterium]|nr:FKBP-type peptidyl-prolyl cis-trans isomerase [Bacteroidales bacterium]
MAVGYFIGTGTSGGIKSESQITLKTKNDSLNYFLGVNWGYSVEQAPWEIDADILASGLVQVLKDTSAYDPVTANAIFGELTSSLQAQEAQKAEDESMKTMEDGITFLEENGKKEGIITTESGLQYEIVTKGDGPMPKDTSTVSVFYEGTLIDGTVFDSSYDTGDTVSFPLNGVIPGWTEGLQLMPVGSTYMFYIPSNLGYGSRGGGPIPANSALIFKVELLEIK